MSDKRWLVLSVEAPSGARDALMEGLLALGGTSIEERGELLITYVPEPRDVEEWLTHARQQVGDEHELTWAWQRDEDWSEGWKRGLQPRRVGRSIIVAPTWTTPETRDGDRVIVIDPEMAFGTGEHATTRGALRALEKVTRNGDRVLDVGTGSAILAIGAAMLGAAQVIGIDNDPDAILNARDNIVRNGVNDVVQLDLGIVDPAYLERLGPARFDTIVANVLSSVLKPLLASFHESVVPNGHVILGGILETEADEMMEAAVNAGFDVVSEDLEDEWWGVLLQRPDQAAH